ncbi:MAG: sulfatase [Bacteroidota bacterium]
MINSTLPKVALSILIASVLIGCQNQESQKSKPNIVFIMGDDCTNWDLATYGSVDAITPNIDKLAADGMKFTRCYQAAPMCSPTRHNIFTGLYPVKTGAYPNHTFVNEGTESIVQYLRPLGYRVALSGKRHIQPETIFDFEFLGKDKDPEFDLVEDFIKDASTNNQPFALMLTSNQPHDPWDKGDPSLFNAESLTLPPFFPDTEVIREAYTRYLAEINYLDNQVGTALDLLEKYGLTDNTLVIFASEQGSVWPFAKWTGYEAGVKSALIAKMPGMIEPGSTFKGIVEYSDLLPTFIEMAGGVPAEKLDGVSLVPILKGETEKGKEYAYSLQTTRGINNGSDHFGVRSIVNEEYRYVINLTPEETFLNTINNNPNPKPWYTSWEMTAKTDKDAAGWLNKFKHRPKEELYQIIDDKWCLVNLADKPEYSKIKATLKHELAMWMASCDDWGVLTEMEALDHMWRNRKD